MPGDFQNISAEAERRWQGLSAGDAPWVRIGSALCGQAAGCDAVVQAVEGALSATGGAVPGQLRRLHRSLLRRAIVGRPATRRAKGLLRERYAGDRGRDRPGTRGRRCARRAAGPRLSKGVRRGDCLPPALPGTLQDLDFHSLRAVETKIALRNAGNIDPSDIYQYVANGGYHALHRALTEMEPADTLEQVNASGLRGRGGAAFPTGTKWRFLAGSNAPVKYILCNCEEGDPGAFNDKAIVESDPHTLIEGILLAGYSTGANAGYIFIRHGHDGPIDRAREALAQARELGLVGEDILGSGFSFELEVALTGDSYVAGEESALMEAIEGSRAMPRFRPPFPAPIRPVRQADQHQQRKDPRLCSRNHRQGRGMVRIHRPRAE